MNGAQWRPAGLVEAAISRQRGEYVRHGLVTSSNGHATDAVTVELVDA